MSCPIPVPECCSPSAFSPQHLQTKAFPNLPSFLPALNLRTAACHQHPWAAWPWSTEQGLFWECLGTVVFITVVMISQWCFAKAAGTLQCCLSLSQLSPSLDSGAEEAQQQSQWQHRHRPFQLSGGILCCAAELGRVEGDPTSVLALGTAAPQLSPTAPKVLLHGSFRGPPCVNRDLFLSPAPCCGENISSKLCGVRQPWHWTVSIPAVPLAHQSFRS